MRVGQLPLLPYFKPGHDGIANALSAIAADHTAALLANHGPVVSDRSLREAVFNAEELEDSARIWLTLKPLGYVPLTVNDATADCRHHAASRGNAPG